MATKEEKIVKTVVYLGAAWLIWDWLKNPLRGADFSGLGYSAEPIPEPEQSQNTP